MNIALSDSTNFKFSKPIAEWWQKDHSVQMEIGASENLAQWADIYFIDWYDNNIQYLYKWYQENPTAKKPKVCVRVIDVDFWTRGVRNQKIVDWVDKFICIAPHIEAQLYLEKDDETQQPINWNGKLKCIQPGVDLNKFTPKVRKTDGFQVGMVLGDMWWYKNHMGGLDIFTQLAQDEPQWHLHIRGNHEPGQYNPIMYDHYLKSRGIEDRVTLYPFVDDMNEWYEQIDFLLHPGMKEAFCYAVAEAMAKGIKPVINDFYGSEHIWMEEHRYKTHAEALTMFNDLGSSRDLREFIRKHYNLKRMMLDINSWLEI